MLLILVYHYSIPLKRPCKIYIDVHLEDSYSLVQSAYLKKNDNKENNKYIFIQKHTSTSLTFLIYKYRIPYNANWVFSYSISLVYELSLSFRAV